jgi:hypothetical protein
MSRRKYTARNSGWENDADKKLDQIISPQAESALNIDPQQCRILEIGPARYFKQLLPAQTTFYFSGEKRVGRDQPARLSVGAFLRLAVALRRGDYDLIALGPLRSALWRRDRFFVRNLSNLFKRFFRQFGSLGQYAVRFAPKKIPIVVIDRFDEPFIGRQNFWIVKRCRHYFKRELPQNHWNVFLNTTSRNETVANIRCQPDLAAAVSKLKPLPLLPSFDSLPSPPVEPIAKTVDIFYVGVNETTTVRTHGRALLEELVASGRYRVDLPEKLLPHDEFLARCARSWLVWSPEGQGWDCWRHYEAIAMGAVPVINYPSIDRYRPLIDREHCFLYGCEGKSLIETFEEALADRERIRHMAVAGWDHIKQHYSRESLLSYLMA